MSEEDENNEDDHDEVPHVGTVASFINDEG